MGRLGQILIFCTIALLSVPVQAEWLHIPKWTQHKIGNETLACYNFDDAKRLKHLDNEHDLLLEVLAETSSMAVLRDKLISTTQHRLMVMEMQRFNDQRTIEKMTVRMTEAETQVQELQQSAFSGSGWMWVALSGLTGVILGGVAVLAAGGFSINL